MPDTRSNPLKTRSELPTLPISVTKARWLEVAMGDLAEVHADHLHCERKAAQSALSLLRSYPDRPAVVAAVTRLAHEETAHVVQVSQLITRRGETPTQDVSDDYAKALRAHIRKREPERLLDTLIVFALIEARSAERLRLLADALTDEPAKTLYTGLATAELRHRDTFVELALGVVPNQIAVDRLWELAEAESQIIADLPIRPRIH